MAPTVNCVEICLLLVAIPVGLMATGFGFARGFQTLSSAERLAVAMLAGLGAIIWAVSIVNLALPLAGAWGWLCVLPLAGPLARAEARRQLGADLAGVFFNRRGAAVVAGTGAFLAALLWPLWSRPEVVFYDGTSGHDAFFWIVGAEHLKRHTYLQPAVTNAVFPLFYSIESSTGLRPVWGRMAGEGLLALLSNLTGASPLKIYVAGSAALFFPWVAAVFLVARTFLGGRFSAGSAVALVTLQPAFIFFQANGNLPNLLGVIAGAGVVVALARCWAEASSRHGWLRLFVLSGHALMCAYPEMLPAIALVGGLLVARAWWRAGAQRDGTVARALAGATALVLVVNPVTTLRAWSGLASSLAVSTQPEARNSLFDTVAGAAWPPAMATLSVAFGQWIGAVGGGVCCVVLAAAVALALLWARDRFGAAALLAGAAAIVAYTVATGFSYGWQKAAQFSGVFVAALVPFGAMLGGQESDACARRWRRPVLAATMALFAAATAANLDYVYRWSARKYLTRDWFAAREFSRMALRNVPVRVETQTFERPFFYTMWAAYFLDDSRLYFTRERVSGGYLRPSVEKYPPDWVESPRASLVAGEPEPGAEAGRVWRHGTLAIVFKDAEKSRSVKP